ncbi:hypothetical protein P9112_014281 [Eukaryota sp. TZLM1-RC]
MQYEWESQQRDVASRVVTIPPHSSPLDISMVGGVDVSFSKDNTTIASACLTVLTYPELKLLYSDTLYTENLHVPYKTGFLAFREYPLVEKLFNKLKTNQPELIPDVLLVDGCGIHHDRSAGSASHIGVHLNVPTIGVSKTLLCIQGLDTKQVRKEAESNLYRAGDYMYLWGEGGKVLGAALRPTDTTIQPIYVSIGHLIDLESSCEIVARCCRYRIPEPIRFADQISRKQIRDNVVKS